MTTTIASIDDPPMARHTPAGPRRRPPGADLRGTRSRLLLAFLTLLPLLDPLPAPARQHATGLSAAEFRERLALHLGDTALDRAVTGVLIVRVRDSAIVAERNSLSLLHPGSNLKLFTTGAALALLPPEFAFRTTLWGDAAIDDGVLEGSLYVQGGGDPLIDSSGVDSIAGMAAAAGIRTIRGDLVADPSFFDTLGWGRGWMWDDEPDPSGGFVTPLSMDRSAARIVVLPGARAGDAVSCAVRPGSGYFEVSNTATTVPAGTPDSLVVTRLRGTDRIVVEGTLAAGSRPDTTFVSVRFPTALFLHELRERLRSRGVSVEGGARTGRATGPVRLGSIEHHLREVITRINKESDNLGAEALLKTIGGRTSGGPGSAKEGLASVRRYLASFGVDTAGMILADGSGVSWYSAVTASDIVALLLDQHARASTYQAFLSSLPRAGFDGTLSGRMAATPAAGRVSAKTGTLTGVSSLSGYVTTLSHDLLAFSIVVNHFPGRARDVRSIQDAILSDLVLLDPSK